MNKKDIQFLVEAWGGKGAYQPEDHSDDYGPFNLNEIEQNIVDAYVLRTKLVELLRFIKEHKPELYNNIMEEIVLMNIKSPTGM